ncbi:mitogen-activated protein kinase kinase PBS2 [Sporobolomyces salmoneus]|uniref:mitogen-activated protein kinase kinase PBS2 n=1 Tax=Sporobolomyces salmoneus TaxID=183962 RepID=UPI00316C9452
MVRLDEVRLSLSLSAPELNDDIESLISLLSDRTVAMTLVKAIAITPKYDRTGVRDPLLNRYPSRSVYSARIPSFWCIGSVAHGGFLLSLLTRAATTHQTLHSSSSPPSSTKHLDPAHVSSQFLSASVAGDCEVEVSVLSVSKRWTRLDVELWQYNDSGEDKKRDYTSKSTVRTLRIRAHFLFTQLENVFDLETSTPGGNDLVPTYLNRLCPILQHPTELRDVGYTELPGKFGFKDGMRWKEVECVQDGTVEGRGELRWACWFELTQGEDLTKLADLVPFFADCSKNGPEVLGQTPGFAKPKPSWYPTLTLAMDFKSSFPLPSSPSSGPVSKTTFGLFASTKTIQAGRHDLTVEVWTSPADLGADGGKKDEDWRSKVRCVGVSTQMALTTPMSFNQSKASGSNSSTTPGSISTVAYLYETARRVKFQSSKRDLLDFPPNSARLLALMTEASTSSTRPLIPTFDSFSSTTSSTSSSLLSGSDLTSPSSSGCSTPTHDDESDANFDLSASSTPEPEQSRTRTQMQSTSSNGGEGGGIDRLDSQLESINLSSTSSANPSSSSTTQSQSRYQSSRTTRLPPTIVAEGGGPLDLSSSPDNSSLPSPSPSASTSTSTTSPPPPLVPRQTAPPAPAANGTSPPTSSIRPNIPPSAASTSSASLRRPGPSALKAGVRGGVAGSGGPLKMPPSLAAKMAAMTSRTSSSSSSTPGNPPIPSLKPTNPPAPPPAGSAPPALAPRPMTRPGAAPAAAGRTGGPVTGSGGGPGAMGGMAARRRGMGAGLTLSAMGVGASSSTGTENTPSNRTGVAGAAGAGGEKKPRRGPPGGMKLSLNGDGELQAGGDVKEGSESPNGGAGRTDAMGTPFSNFRKIVDPSGRLNFAQKAILHADGVDFSSGASFKIKMDDFELFEELGKGNYGTVQKVIHRPTAVTMALKEIRLELDDSKLKTIITELDILHRATSPYIIDFYGAFFIESCVYYCMEFMDAGSLEVVAGIDVPEDVLARITRCMVEGLKFLKDELKIMHRDVKPTNVLLSKTGACKLCDFGVSGQLDRSLAKTNIGCQSYMAPERIKGESQGAATSYTASSDVWSLGLSIIEAAIGHYPYPPETYSNVFAQLTAIVHGDPPSLPDRYSETARDFVAKCLEKQAERRPTYAQLLQHPWLREDKEKNVDMEGWISKALAYREEHPRIAAPALA